jgi:hypothetical protein
VQHKEPLEGNLISGGDFVYQNNCFISNMGLIVVAHKSFSLAISNTNITINRKAPRKAGDMIPKINVALRPNN